MAATGSEGADGLGLGSFSTRRRPGQGRRNAGPKIATSTAITTRFAVETVNTDQCSYLLDGSSLSLMLDSLKARHIELANDLTAN